jgi:hypothetical protein
MDGATLQSITYMGYGIAAQNIGLPFDLYRPSGASNPLDPANKLKTLPAHFRVDDALKRFSTYDNPLFSTYVDGRETQPGDYLISATAGTYLIVGMQPLLPILSVQCSRTVTILRPISARTTSALMSGWPASIVKKSARGTDEAKLPGDVANPNWEMLIPSVAGVNIDIEDVVTDDLMRLYFIEQAELSDYGWRCQIKQLPQINGATIYHYAQVVEATGKMIVFRKTTTLTGPNAPTNPVDGDILVAIDALAGDSTITLTAPDGNWFLEVGDSFTLPGDLTVYSVTSRSIAVDGSFGAVAISPALAAPVSAGATVSVVWVNDYPAKARISRYSAQEMSGTTVTAFDLKVVLSAQADDGRVIPPPQPVDRMIIDGECRSVGIVTPRYSGDLVGAYEVQAR